MTQPADMGVADALDTLVHQFSDKLSFYRELIQNSVDAGSSEVEVAFEFEPGKGGKGIGTIYVDDWGEGMDRKIIDTRLTRLFSSTKDDDLTKIGRFGIGFVSVFAIQPDAVCVDTARGGETWRILFNADRSFRRIELDEPVEGTKVRIIKETTQEEFAKLIADSKATISYWCKHVNAAIIVDGERISGPVSLDGERAVRVEVGEAVVAAAYGRPFFGFYNRGLTLLEGDSGEHYGHVAFKVSSRYLEHTLTRDNVIRDKHYEKAMAIVDRVVRQELPMAVFGAVDQIIRERKGWPIGLSKDVERAMALPIPQDAMTLAFARTPSGKLLTVRNIRAAASSKKLIIAQEQSVLTDLLEADGYTVCVVGSKPGTPHPRAVQSLAERATDVVSAFCTATEVKQDPAIRPLLDQIVRVGSELGYRLREARLGDFRYPESAIANEVAIGQREFGGITPTSETQDLTGSGLFFKTKLVLVLNADSGFVRSLIKIAHSNTAEAAYYFWRWYLLGRKDEDDVGTKLIDEMGALL